MKSSLSDALFPSWLSAQFVSMQKITALLVAVSFLLAPLQVLAQEQVLQADANLVPPEDTAKPIDEDGGSGTQALSGDPDEPLTLNSSFTYQSTAPHLDKATWAFTHKIPLTVPPGRNSLQPDLVLAYSSQSLEDSIVGYGWNVNIPYIERINRMGTDKLYTSDYFYASLSGELASTTEGVGAYRAKVEEGSFLKYTFATTSTTSSWTVYNKQGTRYTYGSFDDAKEFNGASSTQVFKWMLTEVRDTNNNFIRYTYYKNGGRVYPDKIYYTGSGVSDGVFTVEFTRESRPDVITSYKSAFLITTNYRITEIAAKINSTWVRKYALSYTSGNNTKRSLLTSVTESGQDESGSGNLSLPPITFEYVNDTPGFATATPFAPPRIANATRVIADVDGNGLSDITNYSYHPLLGTTTGGTVLNYNKGITSSTGGPFFYENWGKTDNSTDAPIPRERGARFFDVNGDGTADVINSTIPLIRWNTYQPGQSFGWTLSTTTSNIPEFSAAGAAGSVLTVGLLGNLNGDGLTDFVRAHQSISQQRTADIWETALDLAV